MITYFAEKIVDKPSVTLLITICRFITPTFAANVLSVLWRLLLTQLSRSRFEKCVKLAVVWRCANRFQNVFEFIVPRKQFSWTKCRWKILTQLNIKIKKIFWVKAYQFNFVLAQILFQCIRVDLAICPQLLRNKLKIGVSQTLLAEK